MWVGLWTLACLNSTPPPRPVASPPPQLCSWTWGEGGLSAGPQGPSAGSVRVVNTNSDATPDLVVELGQCEGGCERAVLQGCGDGSFQAVWGPEQSFYVEVRRAAPAQLVVGRQSGSPECVAPTEQSLSWTEGAWEDQGTCYEPVTWDAARCGALPQPACGEEEGSVRLCDYKLLAAYWELEEGEVRARIRERFASGEAASVHAAIAAAKAQPSATCSAAELHFSSADLTRVQAHLGADADPEQAVFEAYCGGSYRSLSREAGIPWAIEPAVVLYEEGYTACDAAQLGAAWGTEAPQARMRDLLLAGEGPALDAQLQRVYAEAPVPCAFHETGLYAAQFERLAESWDLTPDQAALRAADLISTGQMAAVQEQLR